MYWPTVEQLMCWVCYNRCDGGSGGVTQKLWLCAWLGWPCTWFTQYVGPLIWGILYIDKCQYRTPESVLVSVL